MKSESNVKLKDSINKYRSDKNGSNFVDVLKAYQRILDEDEKDYTIIEGENNDLILGVKYPKTELSTVKEMLDEDDNLEIKKEEDDFVVLGEKKKDSNSFIWKSMKKLAKSQGKFLTPFAVFDSEGNQLDGTLMQCLEIEYYIDPDIFIQPLVSLLAEEYFAWYKYEIIAQHLKGEEMVLLKEQLKIFGYDELHDHAEKLSERIIALASSNILANPECWKNHVKYPTSSVESWDKEGIITSLLQDEYNAAKHYREVLDLYKQSDDVTTKNILEQILADEEEHITFLERYRQ